jgi:predicted nucleic acid-binding protein
MDASALLKLTVSERESLALIDYIHEHNPRVATSVIAEVEVARALHRLRIERGEQDQAMRGMYLVNVDADVRLKAMRLKPQFLRALDAIHVATAATIGDSDLEFLTYDDRMADAARAAGLKVVQPGR